MLGHLGGVLLGAALVDPLQCPAHLLMEPDSPRREHLLVERLPEEGVGEPEAHRGARRGPLLYHRRSLGLLQGREQLLLTFFRHTLQHVQSELPAYHRSDGQHPVALLAQPGEPFADDVPQPLGDAHGGVADEALTGQVALLHQVPQHLLYEQRVALRLAVHRL